MDTMIQPKVTGYRQLSAEEGALMNEIKALGPQVETLRDKLQAHLAKQWEEADEAERQRITQANPGHWLTWGVDGIQAALMYLTRAVAQPTAF